MEARIFLVALHFNENCIRSQAVTEQGNGKWSISYPKAREGNLVVGHVKVPLSFQYVEELFNEVLSLREICSSYSKVRVNFDQNASLPIAASYQYTDQTSAVASRVSRTTMLEKMKSSVYLY